MKVLRILALLLLAFELEILAKEILSDRKIDGFSQTRTDTGNSIKDIHGNSSWQICSLEFF